MNISWLKSRTGAGRPIAEGNSAHATPEAPIDSRAERYFARAARYNAIATELGYLSLEVAVRAGRMSEILRRADAGKDGAVGSSHLDPPGPAT